MEVSPTFAVLLMVWSFAAPVFGAAAKWFFYDRRKLKGDAQKVEHEAQAIHLSNQREGLNKLERGADVMEKLLKQQESAVSRLSDVNEKLKAAEAEKAEMQRELDRRQGAINEHRIERGFWAENQLEQQAKMTEMNSKMATMQEHHEKQMAEMANQIVMLKRIMKNNGIEFESDKIEGMQKA